MRSTPLDFPGWHQAGGLVFLWLWLDHMYMRSKGFAMHSPPKPDLRRNPSPLHPCGLPLDFSENGLKGNVLIKKCVKKEMC
jgi:hypothetical protein